MDTMYHATSASYRDSITEHGIDWRLGRSYVDEFESAEPGNYLYDADPDLPGSDIWLVDVSTLELVPDPYNDPYSDFPDAYFTTEPIPPGLIQLVA